MQININKNDVVHFVGIGGIGMSGIALIMKSLGYTRSRERFIKKQKYRKVKEQKN